MRIPIIGFVVFVIWSIFSVWLYVNIIKPSLNEPVAVQLIPETQTNVADSVMQLTALKPNDLMIYFEFDDTKFKPDLQTDNSIAEYITWLDKNPGSTINITGHTDIIGPAKYNQTLGLKRAQIIQKYLESKGFDANKMITDSKGKDQPVADQTTEDGRAKNRRAVITIKN